MLRKRYYILFVARDDDGRVRRIPLPLHYVYGFVGAALVGAFTIAGMAGSYTRMLLKTESFNQIRQDRESLRKDYRHMAQVAQVRNVQVASLGALASEVTALYGLRQNRLSKSESAANAVTASAPVSLTQTDDMDQQQVEHSISQFYALRAQAMSGEVGRALENGLSPDFTGDWTALADAPSLWPVEGRVSSGFGNRTDPIIGGTEFHTGIDICAPMGTQVRATADGEVIRAGVVHGYGREVELDNGHDIETLYAHLSGYAVVTGQHVTRGQVIGYIGESGRATGPNLHYEVRVHGVPVNPHPYLRVTYAQIALGKSSTPAPQGN